MIEIIFLDVDGCLTDGKIVYSPNGDELKFLRHRELAKAWQKSRDYHRQKLSNRRKKGAGSKDNARLSRR